MSHSGRRAAIRYALGALVTIALALGTVALSQGDAQRTLTIAQGIDPGTFDPFARTTSATWAVLGNVFDALLQRDQDGNLQPSLATDWSTVDDSTWEFTLRQGVLWHDGTEFTAEDVAFTLDRARTDETLLRNPAFLPIVEVEVVDDYTVRVHTDGPYPLLINEMAQGGSSGILPRHVFEELGAANFNTAPIGTGPYRFVSWVRDDRVVLEAFDDHWRGRAEYDQVVFRVIPEASTRVAEVMTGGVDIAPGIPPLDVPRVNASGRAQVVPAPTTRAMMFYVQFHEDAATSDIRVRQAIDYAIDNQTLVDVVMGGAGVPVRGLVAPGVTGADMDLYDSYRYDPERALELLAEAGYGPGELEITIQGPHGRYLQDSDIAEVVGLMLQEVGVKTVVETMEWSAYRERVTYNFVEHIALIGLANSSMDAGVALASSYRARMSLRNYVNPYLGELLDVAEINMNFEERNEQLREAFAILDNELPFIYLFNLEDHAAVSLDVDWMPRIDEQLWAFDARPRQ